MYMYFGRWCVPSTRFVCAFVFRVVCDKINTLIHTFQRGFTPTPYVRLDKKKPHPQQQQT
jgi:hypothetical protein